MVKFTVLAVMLILAAIAGGYWYGINNPVNKKTPTKLAGTPVASDSVVVDGYSAWKTCTNTLNKFIIKYPSDWSTLTNNTSESCQLFDPLRDNLNSSRAKVVINYNLDPKSFSDLKTSVQKSNEEQLLLHNRQIEINGQIVDRVETESTGIGTKVKGAITIYYFFNGNPLILITAIENDKSKQPVSSQIFDQIAGSLKF